MVNDCIFCQIINGKSPAHILWEDENHMAFLSIFPNTPGFSVVVTKEHLPSYVVDLDDVRFANLFLAARKVCKMIDLGVDDVARTGIIAEGYGVDHAHIKLFPMHQTPKSWAQIKSNNNKVFSKYEGYISSHDGPRASDLELQLMAKKLRGFEIWRQSSKGVP